MNWTDFHRLQFFFFWIKKARRTSDKRRPSVTPPINIIVVS